MSHPPEISIGPVSEWLTLAIQDVSETTFGLPAHPASLQDQASTVVGGEELIVACIGIRGDCQVEVAMYFPKALASHLTSLTFGLAAEEQDDQMHGDVAGEFSNMVVGAVKSRVSDSGVSCTMTVPRVVRATQESPELLQKVQAAFAVIRGTAGPRKDTANSLNSAGYQLGDNLLRVDLHL